MATTKKNITLKSGEVIPKGAKVKFVPGARSICTVEKADKTFVNVRITSAFPAPTIATLEKYSNDGIARTPTGKKTEPDGYGDDHSPSWLIVLGFM